MEATEFRPTDLIDATLSELDALIAAASAALADTSSSALPESFTDWLFTTAQTELGEFPDWPYLRDFAQRLESGRDLVVLKRRQILISWVVAAYQHFVASRNPYHHCAVVSAEGRAARKQGRRIVTVARRDGYDVQGVELIKYPNGSEITILPSTEHAGVGESIKVMHYDEFAFHPYGEENMSAIQPAVSNSRGQTITTSTSNPELGESGPFYELWKDSPRSAQCFYGRNVRPDQDDSFFIGESLRPGMTASKLSAWYPLTPEEAFVTHSGLVFGEDHDGVLIFHPQQNVKLPMWSWRDSKWRIASVDPGGTGQASDPTGITSWGIASDERCQQFEDKLWRGNPGSVEIGAWLLERHKRAPYDFVTVDPTAPTTIVDLQHLGLPALAANNDRPSGMSMHAWLLKQRRLLISPECEETIHQYGTYWVGPRKDRSSRSATIVTLTPKDHHGELMDTNRYNGLRLTDGLPSGAAPRQPIQFHRSGATRFGR